MKVIEITTGMRDIAEGLADEIPAHIRNSIMGGKHRIVGMVAEVALAHHLQGRCASTYEYDVIAPCNTTFEVKAKKSKVCRPGDEASVCVHNTRQKADYYAFLRVKPDLSKVAVAGYYPQAQYIKDARFLCKGEKDGDNGFIVREDCYNMFHRDLWDDYKKK